MKLLGWVFIAAVAGSLIGTLPTDILTKIYFSIEQESKQVKDLYFIAQINPSHPGLDAAATCPNLVQEGERTLEMLFHTIFVTRFLDTFKGKPECKYALTEKDEDNILVALENPASVKDLFHATSAEMSLQNGFDGQMVVNSYGKLLEKDDSVLAVSFAMKAVHSMWSQNNALNLEAVAKHVDIADMFAQADSFDAQLSFDNDIVVTSNFFTAAVAWASVTGTLELTDDQVIGFANFFINAKPTTNTERFYTFEAVKMLMENKFKVPVYLEWLSRKPFIDDHMPLVARVIKLNSEEAEVQVKAKSITRIADNEVIVSNAPFAVHEPEEEGWMEKDFSTDQIYKKIFEYTLPTGMVPGYYDVDLEVVGGAFITGDDAIRKRIKIPYQAEIKSSRIALTDKGGEKKWMTEIGEGAEIGREGRISVEFEIVEAETGKELTAHQAFVICSNNVNDKQLTFIAEKKKGKYVANIDVSGNLEFGGSTSIIAIIGDALFYPASKTIIFGKVQVNGIPEPEDTSFNNEYLKRYAEPKEIKHTFREPEARPPAMISFVFTGLCAVPLVGLLVVWSRLGVNVSRMESAFLPFHIAIGSIFGLYFLYWLKLDMFTTLKYLGILGSATFILGNRVLSTLAGKPK